MAFTSLSGATLTSLNGLLKEYYLPPVIESVNNDVLLLQRLDTSNQEIQGKYAVVPIHTGRASGVGARAEGAPLPDAGAQAFQDARFDLTAEYGTVRVTGLSMVKTASDAGAFLQALKSELDFKRNDLRKDLARQLYGDGTGVLATCGTTTTANIVVLGTGGAEAINKGQFYIGQIVDIGTLANMQSIAQGRTITAITPATPSITISGATVSTTSAAFVFVAGAVGQTVSAEINGVRNAIPVTQNTTFGNIDATAAGNSFWDNLRTAVGGAITMDVLMKAFNQVRQAGGQTSLLITSLGVQRAYYDLFTQTTKFVDPLVLEGGFETLTFMNKPLVADIDAPYGNLYLIDERYAKVFSNDDFHFLDEDGQTLHRNLGYDAYEAVLARYLQFGLTRRNCQLVLSGITVGGGADVGV